MVFNQWRRTNSIKYWANRINPNDNKTKKDLPINIKEVPKKPIEPEIFIDDSEDLKEIDVKELLDFDSDMIILNKDKVISIKIKGSVFDDIFIKR